MCKGPEAERCMVGRLSVAEAEEAGRAGSFSLVLPLPMAILHDTLCSWLLRESIPRRERRLSEAPGQGRMRARLNGQREKQNLDPSLIGLFDPHNSPMRKVELLLLYPFNKQESKLRKVELLLLYPFNKQESK